MDVHYQNLAIVIPCLDPAETLVAYVQDLLAQGFSHIYVVNDGSHPAYTPLFQQVCIAPECTLLTHEENRGKGAALKTAYSHIAHTFAPCRGVITADSDGQHTVKDVCRLADQLLASSGSLLLGGRSFSRHNVPIKSLLGNRMTSFLFFFLHGTWVQDTQTGLRGFDICLLQEMQHIPGERFEYEMAVLTTCSRKKIPIQFISIDTIYIDGNAGSHFRPLTDSLRIGTILFGYLCRFLLSSGLAFVVDIALCWMLLYLLSGVIPSQLLRIGLSVVLARTISMVVNYTLNKTCVFQVSSQARNCFERYLLLAVANMIVLTGLIYYGHVWLGLEEHFVAIVVGAMLCMANYQLQRIWVFPGINLGGAHE